MTALDTIDRDTSRQPLGIAAHLLRALVPSPAAGKLRIVTPAGKAGYVSVDSIAPLGNDQLCYVKDGGGWKIAGYIGGGEPQ